MECPMNIRVCPNGWYNCELCAKERECMAGLYHGEIEEPIIIKVAKIAAEVIDTEVKKNVESIRGDRHKQFMALSPDDALKEVYKYRSQNLHSVEPYKAMSGPTAPGGSKTGKVKKSNKGTKIIVDAWQTNV
jgi:hypothetical protein